jgi:hypothetical protein
VKRRTWIPALALAALVALLWIRGREPPDDEARAPGGPRPPVAFRGRVVAQGAPLPGARVRLYEDLPGGFVAEGSAGADGAFELSWTPTLAVDPRLVFVAAWDEASRFAPAVAPAGSTVLELLPPAEVRGRVVGADGAPVAKARIAAVVRHSFEEAALAESDAQGRFALPLRAPPGAPLDLLVRAGGMAARVDSRFRAGEPLTLHVAPGRPVRLHVVDPWRRPVARARARLAVPWALAAAAPAAEAGPDGVVQLDHASDGATAVVDVEADGHLEAEALAAPGLATEVILWPAREVRLIAWDAWNQRAVEGLAIDADPVPGDGEEWWGQSPGSVGRSFPLRPDAGAGTYLALVPRGKVRLHLVATDYGDESIDLLAGADAATVRLQPPHARGKPAFLRLRAPAGTPEFDLVVADEEGEFLRSVTLRGGSAEVVVPPGVRLQIGSAMAVDGLFLPRHGADRLAPGERRLVRLGTRPAHRLRITTDPAIDGQATLVDTELRGYFPGAEAPVRDGKAELWVRPFRKLHLLVRTPPGFFPHEAELETGAEDTDLELRLLTAARLRCRIEDGNGNPVAFARFALYEPGAGGRMQLDAAPRAVEADAEGVVRFDALRAGKAATEVRADLFRTARGIVTLPSDGMVDGGRLVLEPAGALAGRVVDPGGAPLPGVHVRVLSPRIARLPMPGGGERELYDLAESSVGDGLTDEAGAFSVRDRSPGPPLVGLYPPGASGLAAMAFPPAEEHALARASYVELDLPGSAAGVYLLLGRDKAVLVKTDPPMSLRPLPLILPAGRRSLFVRLRDRRWGAREIDLAPGETVRLELEWQR